MRQHGSRIARVLARRWEDSKLFHLNVGRTDYLGPLCGFFSDEVAEVSYRACKRHGPQVLQGTRDQTQTRDRRLQDLIG
jgi:hypothetical protein